MDPTAKANAFANTFSSKYVLPGPEVNEFTELRHTSEAKMSGLLPLR